jgi:hypothetical protein
MTTESEKQTLLGYMQDATPEEQIRMEDAIRATTTKPKSPSVLEEIQDDFGYAFRRLKYVKYTIIVLIAVIAILLIMVLVFAFKEEKFLTWDEL